VIYLETERLILRDYCVDDFEEYFRLKSDPETMRYLEGSRPVSRVAAHAEFQKVLADQNGPNRKFTFLHMACRDSHETVGSIGYSVVDATPLGKIVDAGYFSFPQFWGKGYTTEAFRCVIDYAFREDLVWEIIATCFAENVGSQRVMQKCGMTKTKEYSAMLDGAEKRKLEYRLVRK